MQKGLDVIVDIKWHVCLLSHNSLFSTLVGQSGVSIRPLSIRDCVAGSMSWKVSCANFMKDLDPQNFEKQTGRSSKGSSLTQADQRREEAKRRWQTSSLAQEKWFPRRTFAPNLLLQRVGSERTRFPKQIGQESIQNRVDRLTALHSQGPVQEQEVSNSSQPLPSFPASASPSITGANASWIQDVLLKGESFAGIFVT